jgi:hypothetical protein
LILAVFVDVLEFLQSLDDIDIIPEINDDVLGTRMEAIIQNSEGLNMTSTLETKNRGRVAFAP